MKDPKNMDILMTIETNIVAAYKSNPQMRDRDVIKALEALNNYYRAKIIGKEVPSLAGDGYDAIVSEYVLGGLEKYSTFSQGEKEEAPAIKRFSSAFKKPTQDENFLAALRKIERSSKRWNERNGERGYLDFIINYVPS